MLQDQVNDDGTYVLKSLFKEVSLESVIEEVPFHTVNHRGSSLPRLVAVQVKRGCTADGKLLTPLYRHPIDEVIPATDMTPIVKGIYERLNASFPGLNHVYCQLYRNGSDFIGAHSDKTLDIEQGTDIVGVSLGDSRVLTLKHKLTGRKVSVTLDHGDVFVLSWQTNRQWHHEIKKQVEQSNARVSLTFRTIATFQLPDNSLVGQGAPNAHDVPTDDSVALLRAFREENMSSEFDWEEWYGNGFHTVVFNAIQS